MKAHFFLFNIEGYGEFFSGITPKRNNDLFYSLNVYKKRVVYHFVYIIKTLTSRSG